MGVRRSLLARSALFALGLVPFALAGLLTALARALLPAAKLTFPARWGAALGWRWAELIFPGIVSLSPFEDFYYVLERISAPWRVRAGESFIVEVTLRNLGRMTWAGKSGPNPVRLGTWNPENRLSPFNDGTWESANRPGSLEREVTPGESGLVRMTFRAPPTPGRYREEFAPVADGLAWFAGQRIVLPMEVE